MYAYASAIHYGVYLLQHFSIATFAPLGHQIQVERGHAYVFTFKLSLIWKARKFSI